MSGLTYRRNGRFSFFADLVNEANDPGARRRLAKHAEEVRDVKGAGSGGAQGVIPPIWLNEAWASVARAPRPFADLVPQMPLPPAGIDQVSVPQATTGPSVAVQATENAAVSETDIVSAALTANDVVTIAGQLDVSRQLFQRALPGTDEFVFADLAAAYDEKVDQQLIIGAGAASGEHAGIDPLSGTIGQTYTQATPDQQTCLTNISQAVSKVYTQRKLGKGAKVAVILHPRRAAWLSAANGTASLYDQPSFAELGLDVSFVADPSVPVTKGASTTEDRIYVVAYNDLRLAEGVQSLIMQDALSGTGTVRLQLYSYSLFIPDRFLKSIAVISGTGLVAPSGW
jgi:Phage capsid family